MLLHLAAHRPWPSLGLYSASLGSSQWTGASPTMTLPCGIASWEAEGI